MDEYYVEAVKEVSAEGPLLDFFFQIPSAVEAMKLGAADYLIKPCDPDELLLVVDKLLETQYLQREVEHLRREVWEHKKFGEFIGQSPGMQEMYRLIQAVSGNQSNVLVTGESGTGKELVARTIHQKGPWTDRPFIAINCGAMSETLLDSQLFGHKKGAFTGAIADHEGVFRAAEGGTLKQGRPVEHLLTIVAGT